MIEYVIQNSNNIFSETSAPQRTSVPHEQLKTISCSEWSETRRYLIGIYYQFYKPLGRPA
jgi:hypothetical protein